MRLRVQDRACIGGFMVDLDGDRRGGYGMVEVYLLFVIGPTF